jgi:hypothetical protein
VVLPTPNCSIRECLEIIPQRFAGLPVQVYVGEQYLTSLVPDTH